MDVFGLEDLKELLDPPATPAVSIYMPTHRTGAEVEGDALRFRASLERARELLGDDSRRDASFLRPLDELVEHADFWRHQAGGLATFAAPGFHRLYRLPAQLPERVVVGGSFLTLPLIEYLQAPDRFYVVGLSQKAVRVWEGSVRGLRPVEPEGVPDSLEEALGRELEPDHLGFHSPKGRAATPIYHGHGAGEDERKQELVRFFREVDAGLRRLLGEERAPVILAAVEYYHPLYRSVSRLSNLAPEGIDGNVTEWAPERLHAAAWPIVERYVEAEIDDALALWESSYGRGKTEVDLASAARHAVAGRVRLLLTEKGRRVWGRMDRTTGGVEVVREGGDDPGPEETDLQDELAEVVIARGGRTLVLPAERMPTRTGVAAVLR